MKNWTETTTDFSLIKEIIVVCGEEIWLHNSWRNCWGVCVCVNCLQMSFFSFPCSLFVKLSYKVKQWGGWWMSWESCLFCLWWMMSTMVLLKPLIVEQGEVPWCHSVFLLSRGVSFTTQGKKVNFCQWDSDAHVWRGFASNSMDWATEEYNSMQWLCMPFWWGEQWYILAKLETAILANVPWIRGLGTHWSMIRWLQPNAHSVKSKR